MKINEMFLSIQGEGIQSGIPTTFIRTPGCNLQCGWCDTVYARDPESGHEMSYKDILAKVKKNGVRHVCITGGEPLIHKEVHDLVERLVDKGYLVSIETNGSISIGEYIELDPAKVVISMDMKCPSSGMAEHNFLENLKILRPTDQLKFVISDDKDLDFAKRLLKANPVGCNIVFQPVFGTDPAWLTQKVLKSGLAALGVRVMVQLHKVIWGEKRGV